jgi:hypothetical protein
MRTVPAKLPALVQVQVQVKPAEVKPVQVAALLVDRMQERPALEARSSMLRSRRRYRSQPIAARPSRAPFLVMWPHHATTAVPAGAQCNRFEERLRGI